MIAQHVAGIMQLHTVRSLAASFPQPGAVERYVRYRLLGLTPDVAGWGSRLVGGNAGELIESDREFRSRLANGRLAVEANPEVLMEELTALLPAAVGYTEIALTRGVSRDVEGLAPAASAASAVVGAYLALREAPRRGRVAPPPVLHPAPYASPAHYESPLALPGASYRQEPARRAPGGFWAFLRRFWRPWRATV